jgi:hypothetical protein
MLGYREQRKDDTINGLTGYSQCFSCSAWMLMSNYTDKINAQDNAGFDEYLKYIETVLGPTMEHVPHPSLYFDVQTAGINSYLTARGVDGAAICNLSFPIDQLPIQAQKGTVIIGTSKLGGLPNGHIILLTGYDLAKLSFIVNDPFGDARGNYSDPNGEGVIYPYQYLLPFIDIGGGKSHIIYWNK